MQGLRVSPAGRDWLTARPTARPLHIFDHVCNLIDDAGRVLSVQSDRLAPGPLSLVVADDELQALSADGFRGWLTVEDSVRVDGSSLWLAGRRIDWSQAGEWAPAPPWDRLRAAQRTWRGELPALAAQLRRQSPPGGLTPLVSATGSLRAPGQGGDAMADRVVRSAHPSAAKLIQALRAWNPSAAGEAAAGLAGLGGGLTPSGDDYLVGAMHALWATTPDEPAAGRSRVLADAAAPRTTPLSAAWLRAGARGEAAGQWHELFEALLEAPGEGVRAAVTRLVRVGHTSGADALAGFLNALASG